VERLLSIQPGPRACGTSKDPAKIILPGRFPRVMSTAASLWFERVWQHAASRAARPISRRVRCSAAGPSHPGRSRVELQDRTTAERIGVRRGAVLHTAVVERKAGSASHSVIGAQPRRSKEIRHAAQPPDSLLPALAPAASLRLCWAEAAARQAPRSRLPQSPSWLNRAGILPRGQQSGPRIHVSGRDDERSPAHGPARTRLSRSPEGGLSPPRLDGGNPIGAAEPTQVRTRNGRPHCMVVSSHHCPERGVAPVGPPGTRTVAVRDDPSSSPRMPPGGPPTGLLHLTRSRGGRYSAQSRGRIGQRPQATRAASVGGNRSPTHATYAEDAKALLV
jgi:hypothetical protein